MDEDIKPDVPQTLEAKYNPKPINRLTCTSSIVRQQTGEEPKGQTLAYQLLIESEEEHYTRRCTAVFERRELDYGWVEEPGMIVIESLAGKVILANPSPEDLEMIKGQTLLLYFGAEKVAEILPGDFLRFRPSLPADLTICCKEGEAKYRIAVYPR